MSPAGQRLDEDEKVGRAMPFVFIVAPLDLARRWWQAWTDGGMQHDGLLIEADGRVPCVVGHRVEGQDIFHGGDELAAHHGDTPLLVAPGLQFVIFRSARMVSSEMRSTNPSSTAFP